MNKEHAELVERLRTYATFYLQRPAKAPGSVPLCAEISYRETHDTADQFADAANNIERLSKDCERLAEALEKAIAADECATRQEYEVAMDEAIVVARTALQLHKGE